MSCSDGCCVSKHVATMIMPLAAYTDPNPVAEVVRGNDCTVRVTMTNRASGSTSKIWFDGRGKTALSLSGGATVPKAAYLLPGETITLETSDSIYAVATESGQVLQVVIETI